jgi:DNA-binding CsgD family transcriptional regulator
VTLSVTDEPLVDRVTAVSATWYWRCVGAETLLRAGHPTAALRVLHGEDWPDRLDPTPDPALPLASIHDDLRNLRSIIDGMVGTPNPLTGQQTRVVACIAGGLTLQEAAGRLFVSRDTVKRTVERSFAVTGTARQPHLVAVALRGRWIA